MLVWALGGKWGPVWACPFMFGWARGGEGDPVYLKLSLYSWISGVAPRKTDMSSLT